MTMTIAKKDKVKNFTDWTRDEKFMGEIIEWQGTMTHLAEKSHTYFLERRRCQGWNAHTKQFTCVSEVKLRHVTSKIRRDF
ncbi:MAG: hypothetical protein ACI802_002342 [Candidatus Paceibacteria bacterium]|jgi:hypothetical protein